MVVGSGPSRAQMEAALPPDRTVFFGISWATSAGRARVVGRLLLPVAHGGLPEHVARGPGVGISCLGPSVFRE